MATIKIFHCDIDEMDTIRVEHDTGYVSLTTYEGIEGKAQVFLESATTHKLIDALIKIAGEAARYVEKEQE